MLKLNAIKPIKDQPKQQKRKPYRRSSFPNGKSSYWIKFKLNPDDARFFSLPKTMIVKFDKELNLLNNENIASLNEFRVTKVSYSTFLPKMCEELNFFEVLYDQEGELITSLFRVKYLIDNDSTTYTLKNFDAFKDMVYKIIFTPSLKEKIIRMVEENYTDDIEEENLHNMANPEMLSIMQRKKKSLEFLNVHVKAMLAISFAIKILSFIINHFCVMRSINIQKNRDLFYRMFYDAEQKYGINGVFLASIAIHESGWGRSAIAVNKLNLFGFGAYDDSPYESALTFDSYASGTDAVAAWLMSNYLNPPGTILKTGDVANGRYYNGPNVSGVNVKYASDPAWCTGVFSTMQSLYSEL